MVILFNPMNLQLLLLYINVTSKHEFLMNASQKRSVFSTSFPAQISFSPCLPSIVHPLISVILKPNLKKDEKNNQRRKLSLAQGLLVHFVDMLKNFLFVLLQTNLGLSRLTAEVSGQHTITHNYTYTHTHTYIGQDSSERVVSSLQRPLPTQLTQETKIYSLSGIRTRDPINRAAPNLRLGTHGHRDWRRMLFLSVL